MAILIASPVLQELSHAANASDRMVRTAVTMGTLQIQIAKTQNLLLDPRIITQGLYRRTDVLTHGHTKKLLRGQSQKEATCSKDILEFDQKHSREDDPTPPFPYPLAASIRFLGVVIDRHFVMDDHCAALLAKARTRQGILTNIAN